VHNITAAYSGSSNYAGSTSAIVVQKVNSSSTTQITSSANPADYSQAITFTAVVTATSPGAAPPAGTVTFKDATKGTTLAAGVPVLFVAANNDYEANFTTTTVLTVGTHTISATFVPASNAAIAPSSGSMAESVHAASTSTTVSSTSPSSVFGQQVTITATVAINASPAVGNFTPAGKVTFVDTTTGVTLGAIIVSGGTASIKTGNLAIGSHNIVATYTPSSTNFAGSNGSATQSVSQAGSTTTISSSGNPGPAGGAVTITATVAPVSPSTGVPTGTVNFIDPNTGIPYPNASNVPVVNGQASFVLSGLVFGNSYVIQANYTSNNGGYASSSDQMTETVLNGTSTQVVLTAPTQPTSTDFVTFTAVVAPLDSSLPIPTGNVQFTDVGGGGSTVLGTASIDPTTGNAVFTTSTTLPPGSNVITAQYLGDGSFFAPSTGTTSLNVFDTPTSISAAITSPKKGTLITPAVPITIVATLSDINGQQVTALPNGGTATITLIQGGGLTGPRTAQFVNGRFVFTNLHVTTSGTYIVEIDFNGLSTQIQFPGSGRLA
jgi:hypothetical protein